MATGGRQCYGFLLDHSPDAIEDPRIITAILIGKNAVSLILGQGGVTPKRARWLNPVWTWMGDGRTLTGHGWL